MQKVCFSDKENLPHPKIGKTQHNGSLRIALETQHNALYESRCGAGTKFYRRFCRNSDRFILRSNICGVGYGAFRLADFRSFSSRTLCAFRPTHARGKQRSELRPL
ncbi:hypothetical protein LEP1GSC079_0871 [Leptospira interrogans str. FPW1039]|uniref:Uncharacterized protein n=1 Tax=Leptospira interrogans str. FPW1039 TaxID=1193040 RepID=A0A0F6IHY0_LEPIR|nr:hypothetical protein LEP1GSC079_0871 [Leptospira interrogans str. FPW1039]